MEKDNQIIQSEKHQTSFDYALNRIKESPVYPYVTELYLFGSCARKEETEKSDVDLFMVLSDDFPVKEPVKKEVVRLCGNISPTGIESPNVDLVTVIGNEWKQSRRIFFRNIREDGKKVWL